MKLLIGIPTFDRRLDIDLFRTLMGAERTGIHHLDFVFPVSSHLSRNRNYCVHELLKSGHDALLFLDSDIGIYDNNFIDKLIDTGYKLDAKIIGGAYKMKKPDEELYVAEEYKNGKLDNFRGALSGCREAEGVGTGIMLVFREVFEKMSDPWFTIVDKPHLDVLPEDFYFCEKAKKLGFKVGIDFRFGTTHFGMKGWSHTPQ